MEKTKLYLRYIGADTEKGTTGVTKAVISLIKALDPNADIALKRRIFCADCNTEFRTFKALRQHKKKTGHKDMLRWPPKGEG